MSKEEEVELIHSFVKRMPTKSGPLFSYGMLLLYVVMAIFLVFHVQNKLTLSVFVGISVGMAFVIGFWYGYTPGIKGKEGLDLSYELIDDIIKFGKTEEMTPRIESLMKRTQAFNELFKR